ncbi:nuclear mRNA export, poly(A)+RNA binding protein [Malassezia yamatoensis]|uniref:mRNA export factor MEX67 n=1 Tax=Malassezia yamatoensis TaxID=253288 RepID=A0AAJ6CGI3_9BASI|nr:nuclear mRNA export, poly(A)+RNA binding protein [Malassezia yamatoensis]
MPKRTQRSSLVAGALRGAGLIEKEASMPIDDDGSTRGSAPKRAQTRRLARESTDPLGRRPTSSRRGGRMNINGLARPANQRSNGKALSERVATDVKPEVNVVQTLRTFLQQRFDPASGLLNLECMHQDPLLLDANIKPPGVQGAHKDLGTAIWKLSEEMFPSLTTLSLAGNSLGNLHALTTLGQYLPKLVNLSLERNELRWVRDLDVLASKRHGLHQLQELLLEGNPMQQSALEAENLDGYRRDVLAKFPSLRILDRRPVSEVEHGFSQLFRGRSAKKTGAEAAKVPLRNFPLQIRPGFIDGNAAQIVPEFLSTFFARYDQDRSQLAPVYSANAQFSFSLNSSPPPRARAERLMHVLPHQKELVLDRYIDLGSRNILRSHNTKALLRTMHQGSQAIVAFLQRLPKTTHPIHDATKFVVDAWLLPNVDIHAETQANQQPDALLYITVHGEFAEAPSQGLRSFDRTFIVAPAMSDSDATRNGWACVIVSDAMTIRHYSKPNAWQPDSLPVGPVDPSSEPAQAKTSTVPFSNDTTNAPSITAADLPPQLQGQEPLAGLSPEQHTLALQLATQTRLIYPYAVQCLVENAWDFAQAVNAFTALQAAQSIPAEAFMS